MKILRLLGLLAVGAATACATEQDFNRWADSFAADWVRLSPTLSTLQQFLPTAEQDALDRQLTSPSREALAARTALARRGLRELATFDRGTFSSEQRTSAALIQWSLEGALATAEFTDLQFVFNQFTGLHVNLVNFLTQSHPIRNRRDVENYLARLAIVPSRIDEGIAVARANAQKAGVMPDFITRSALGQIERFLAAAPRENRFVSSLAERIAALSDVTAEDREKFVAAAEIITTEEIIPAFRRAEALLQEQLRAANSNAGLAWRTDGPAAYAAALRLFTTTEMSADEIHDLGRREVARIEAEMDRLLQQLGYNEGSVKARYEKLNDDLQPAAEPDPRPALVAKYEAYLRDAVDRSKLVFDVTPRAPCVVKREPAFTEKTAAAHYTAPAGDGSRPGIFWAPLPGPKFNIAGMRTLTYHEGIPGHHFQIALQKETEALPKFRRDGVFSGGSAYAEGWALYAEQLAAENNWYDGDIPGQLGQLNGELFRARRLVVDTGLHAKKWTRQQAIDYGIPAHEAERYVAMPGQACSYKVGMIKILALRAKAHEALGEAFSIKQFHNLVLQTGNVPLAVLEQVVDEWIAATGGPARPMTQ